MASKSIALFLAVNLIAFHCIDVHATTEKASSSAATTTTTTTTLVCPNGLNVCLDLLSGRQSNCCTLLQGLADLDAALCLCNVLKAAGGGTVPIPVPATALTLILNACHRRYPPGGFTCPAI
ncbi:putative lipid-binding protein AIR1B [Spinacia oleracea]|uniref:Lipid-binding protein AIR1B n=1 Tax=Spinacia oleracea TaxID=3562 RepID=A0ABM3R6Y5_SPIOL|nr:putative lipid-binding protein AIR1B [Spinacia oleracea]